jgi:MFS family permease
MRFTARDVTFALVARQRSLVILSIAVFVDQLGFGIVLPFLPLYATDLGATALDVGLLLAMYSLGQMLFSPSWGRLSDRIGRRPVIVASAFGLCAGFLIMAFADRLALLFAGRLLLGSVGVSMSTAQAWIADATPPADRGRAMAMLGAVGALGFVLGPALGALGVATGNLRVPYFTSAAFAGANALFAATLLPAVPPTAHAERKTGLRTALRSRSLLTCLAVAFVLTYAFSNIEATFALWTRDELSFSPAENGLSFVFVGLTAAATQALVMPFLARRMIEPRRIAAGLTVLAAGAALLPSARSGLELLGPTAMMAIGFAVTQPSLTAWVSRSAPPEQQGEMLGFAQASSSMARVVGPGLGGVLFDHVGHGWPFRTAACLMVVTAVVAATAHLEDAA